MSDIVLRNISIAGTVVYGCVLVCGFLLFLMFRYDEPFFLHHSVRVSTLLVFCYAFLPSLLFLGATVPWVVGYAYGSLAAAVVFVAVPAAVLLLVLFGTCVCADARGGDGGSAFSWANPVTTITLKPAGARDPETDVGNYADLDEMRRAMVAGLHAMRPEDGAAVSGVGLQYQTPQRYQQPPSPQRQVRESRHSPPDMTTLVAEAARNSAGNSPERYRYLRAGSSRSVYSDPNTSPRRSAFQPLHQPQRQIQHRAPPPPPPMPSEPRPAGTEYLEPYRGGANDVYNDSGAVLEDGEADSFGTELEPWVVPRSAHRSPQPQAPYRSGATAPSVDSRLRLPLWQEDEDEEPEGDVFVDVPFSSEVYRRGHW